MPSACLLEPSTTSGITSPTVSTATGFGFTTSQSLMTIPGGGIQTILRERLFDFVDLGPQ